ncbi:MAG: crossover junction endodeoxyribonuclease RuvC [Patescibacteria group bacterium]
MTILGIDPGTNMIGYGLLRIENKETIFLDYGCINLVSDKEGYSHLAQLYQKIDALIKKWSVDIAAVEKLFFFKNNKTVIQVSEARGVIILAAAQNKLKIKEFTPLQVKQAVSGYGRAEKKQVQKMVRLILGLKKDPQPNDAADALAIAICCAHTADFQS